MSKPLRNGPPHTVTPSQGLIPDAETIVVALRKQRAGLVQVPEQFRFALEAVCDHYGVE
jgi:protein tyrosine phosphatase